MKWQVCLEMVSMYSTYTANTSAFLSTVGKKELGLPFCFE